MMGLNLNQTYVHKQPRNSGLQEWKPFGTTWELKDFFSIFFFLGWG
jgi:hypothetical protein